MANNFTEDDGFATAVTKCSPNLKRFLNGLNLGKDPTGEVEDFPVNYNFLTRLGCLQVDGDGKYFRVLDFFNPNINAVQHGSLRSFDEQQALYQIGRIINVKEDIGVSLAAPEGLRGASVVFTDVVKTGSVVTNLAGGASYHNYGLACDIVLRHFGDRLDSSRVASVDGVLYDSFLKIYNKAGILRWASLCHVEWGGHWSSFPDYAHFQDMDYKPLPYLIYANRCLQNKSNCNFESVAKYWSGQWSKTFEAYRNQALLSLTNLNKQKTEQEERWSTWTEGRGSVEGYKGESKGGVSLLGWKLGVGGLLVGLAGLFFLFGSNKRRS